MSTKNFIPELWSAALLENFHNQTVLTALANRTYEGQFRYGNTIHIPGIVDVKIKDYKAAGRTTEPDEVADTGLDLVIDQEKSFDFIVDDVDRAQSAYSFDAYTNSAAIGLAEDAETFLTKLLTTQGTKLSGALPTDWKSSWATVQSVSLALTRAKVPKANRYLLINPSFEQVLMGPDSKLVPVDTSGSSAGLREATVGRVYGFNVLTSPWLDDDKPVGIGFNASTLAYVSQINETEAMRAEKKIADRVRGLHVYGGKIIRPEAVQVFTEATTPAGK